MKGEAVKFLLLQGLGIVLRFLSTQAWKLARKLSELEAKNDERIIGA